MVRHTTSHMVILSSKQNCNVDSRGKLTHFFQKAPGWPVEQSTPEYPGSHMQPPLLQSPCPEQSFGQATVVKGECSISFEGKRINTYNTVPREWQSSLRHSKRLRFLDKLTLVQYSPSLRSDRRIECRSGTRLVGRRSREAVVPQIGVQM